MTKIISLFREMVFFATKLIEFNLHEGLFKDCYYAFELCHLVDKCPAHSTMPLLPRSKLWEKHECGLIASTSIQVNDSRGIVHTYKHKNK